MAPEILSSNPRYTHKVDMWAVGVIVYILLCGRPPFYEENTVRIGRWPVHGASGQPPSRASTLTPSYAQAQLFRKIRAAQYEFHPDEWDGISKEAKDFMRRLLQVDPKERMDSREALTHPWMEAQASTANMAATLEQLKKFNARRKWRTGINVVRAGVRIQRLREAIQQAVEGEGPIA